VVCRQDAQPVSRTEPSGCELLKPSRKVIHEKPSVSDDVLLTPQVVDSSTPSESLYVAAADDASRTESPPSASGDLTGYCIQQICSLYHAWQDCV